MSVNALRGHLSEFGIVAAKGIGRVDELLDLAESDATLPNAARVSVRFWLRLLRGSTKRSTIWRRKSPAPMHKMR